MMTFAKNNTRSSQMQGKSKHFFDSHAFWLFYFFQIVFPITKRPDGSRHVVLAGYQTMHLEAI